MKKSLFKFWVSSLAILTVAIVACSKKTVAPAKANVEKETRQFVEFINFDYGMKVRLVNDYNYRGAVSKTEFMPNQVYIILENDQYFLQIASSPVVVAKNVTTLPSKKTVLYTFGITFDQKKGFADSYSLDLVSDGIVPVGELQRFPTNKSAVGLIKSLCLNPKVNFCEIVKQPDSLTRFKNIELKIDAQGRAETLYSLFCKADPIEGFGKKDSICEDIKSVDTELKSQLVLFEEMKKYAADPFYKFKEDTSKHITWERCLKEYPADFKTLQSIKLKMNKNEWGNPMNLWRDRRSDEIYKAHIAINGIRANLGADANSGSNGQFLKKFIVEYRAKQKLAPMPHEVKPLKPARKSGLELRGTPGFNDGAI